MACNTTDRQNTIKQVVNLLIKDIKANNPDMTGAEIREEASKAAEALVADEEALTADIEQVDATTEEETDYVTELLKLSDEDIKEMANSATSDKFSWDSADIVEKDVHGNIDGMRKLLKDLHVMGGGKESAEHLEYLDGLIARMDPEFFRKMIVYINTKSAVSDGMVKVTPSGKNDKMGLRVSKTPNAVSNMQSDAEIYTHEVIHSMIRFALEEGGTEALKIKGQVEFIMDRALSELTYQDLMPEVSIDKAKEEQVAKERFDYIFNSENSVDEFIAHALTNPVIMEKLKGIMLKEESENKSLFEKALDVLKTILDIVSGNYDFDSRKENAYEHTVELAFKLAEINRDGINTRNSKFNVGKIIWDYMQKFDAVASEYIEMFWDKYLKSEGYEKPPKAGIAKAKWTVQVLFKMITNTEYRKAFELLLSTYGLKPTGDIQTIIRELHKGDDLSNSVDMLALLSDKIDAAKNTLVRTTASLIHSGFKKKLSTEEEEALTAVLIDTDMSAIFKDKGGIGAVKLQEYLKDPAKLETKIGRLKHALELADKKQYNWNVNQAHGLGRFMATGEAHLAQNFNAVNIARGHLSSVEIKPKKKVIGLVDQIATLTALKYTNPADKAVVSKLLSTERKGVENIIRMQHEFKRESARTVFKDNKTNIIKGYSREVFDDRLNMLVAPVSDAKRLAEEGYELKYELKKVKGDRSAVPMAMYVSDAFTTSEYYRTATRLTSTKSKGTSAMKSIHDDESLTDSQKALKSARALQSLNQKAREIVIAMENGTFDSDTVEYGIAPQMDQYGEVVDYRYMMEKDNKKKHLGQNTAVSEVLSRSFSHTLDKEMTQEQNLKVLDIVLGDMKENYEHGNTIGKNNKEYIVIKEGSTEPLVQDLLEVLPPMFKDAMKRNKHGEIAVRADLFFSYFGYRHASLANSELLKKFTPAAFRKFVSIAEKIWMEFIKIAKIDILIKMPVVIIGNLISNAMYGIITGTSPFRLIREYITSTREAAKYFRRHTELQELKMAKRTGNVNNLDLRKIPMLESQLQKSSIHELAELGIYQSIIEDMDHKELESTNRLKKTIDDKMENWPELVKDGANWLFLTEKTGYFKFMNKVLTMSDLIARDVENRKLKIVELKQANGEIALPKWYVMKDKEHLTAYKYKKTTKRLTGKARKEFLEQAAKERHLRVLNSFVNYNKASGRYEEYLNKIGAIMFTKYAKRIQRVITDTAASNPLTTLVALTAEQAVGDVETIFDQSLLTKNWYTLGLSSNDWIPGTNPFARIMEVIEPPLFQLATGKGF